MSSILTGYANPTTPSFDPAGSGGGGGGGAGTFTSITFPVPPGGVALSDSLQETYEEAGAGNRVKVYSSVSGELGPMYVGGELTVQDVGQVANQYNRMNYRPSSVVWQQASTGTSFPFLTVDPVKGGFDLTGITSINGSPPLTGDGPVVQSGTISLSVNGQTFALPKPYTSSLQVVVQGTANAAGVNGFFTVGTFGSLTEFRVFYSGELIYGPIELFWIASGV